MLVLVSCTNNWGVKQSEEAVQWGAVKDVAEFAITVHCSSSTRLFHSLRSQWPIGTRSGNCTPTTIVCVPFPFSPGWNGSVHFTPVFKLLHNQLGTGDLWDVGCDKVVALETALPHRVSGTKRVLRMQIQISTYTHSTGQLLSTVHLE